VQGELEATQDVPPPEEDVRFAAKRGLKGPYCMVLRLVAVSPAYELLVLRAFLMA